MKKTTLILISFFSVFYLIAQNQANNDLWSGDESATVNINLTLSQPLSGSASRSGSLLYDNGPLVNSAGTGAGGADESVLQSNTLGMNIFGFGAQHAYNYWVADDFTISAVGGWDVDQFVFYCYQTGSLTTSTITELYFLVYDGVPGQPGSSVVWGDNVTNRLSSSVWTNIYRVSETSSGSINRPIMENTCNVNFHLNSGTYWIAWQFSGTLTSGPWAPPITITGQAVTGNALQSLDDGVTWNNANDSGSNTPQQGFPFLINGSETAQVPVSNWALIFGIFLIGAFMIVRYRRRLA